MDRTDWSGWKATIRPTKAGTFGIYWSNAPAMERRGGYSGPYNTREEAVEGVQAWCEGWHMTPDDYVIVQSQEAE